MDELKELRQMLVSGILSARHLSKIFDAFKLNLCSDGVTATPHPYGFTVFRFNNESTLRNMRVHAWLPGERVRQIPDWPIHCHPRPLKSHVVCGVLRHQEFHVEEASNGANLLYRVNYEGIHSVISPTAIKCNVRSKVDVTLNSGATYYLPEGVFHQADIPNEKLTCTLACEEDNPTADALVVGHLEDARQYRFTRYRHDSNTARHIAQIVLSHLEHILYSE